MSKEISLVEYVTEAGANIQLTPEVVKQYLVSGDPEKVTDQELGMFMMLCKFQGLNPFLKEAYLIKFGTSPATIVTGKEAFLKRATRHEHYRGHKTGLEDDGQTAWAEVYKEGFEFPIRVEVDLDEYLGKKANGEVNAQWKSKPKTMLKKVALVQALREAFPESLGGMYTEEETDSAIDITPEKTPSKSSSVQPAKKETAKKKTASKEDEGDARAKLKELLGKAYAGDVDKMQAALKEVSVFMGKDRDNNEEEKFITSIDSTKSDKWIRTSYGKLKTKLIEEGLIPKDCTYNPDTCNASSFNDGLAYCGDKDCPMQANKEF